MKRNAAFVTLALSLSLFASACSKESSTATTSEPTVQETGAQQSGAQETSAPETSAQESIAPESIAPDSAAATETTAVTLVLDWTPNTNHSGFYLAKEKGFYKERGIEVTIIEPGNEGGLAQLEAGNAQFAVTAAESLLPARAAQARIVSVASIIQHNTSSLVVPADRNIERPKDLEGKTYGGFGGELEKALIDKLVSCDGGDPTKVKYVEIGNVDYKVGLERNDYDAVWVFDGWDAIRLDELEGMALVKMPMFATSGPTAGCLPDWYTPLLATSESMISSKPEIVRSFVEATAQGFELARTDAGAAAEALLAGAPELDRALVEKSARYLATRYADSGVAWGTQDLEVWSAFAAFLADSKILTAPIDTKDVFTTEFLPK